MTLESVLDQAIPDTGELVIYLQRTPEGIQASVRHVTPEANVQSFGLNTDRPLVTVTSEWGAPMAIRSALIHLCQR